MTRPLQLFVCLATLTGAALAQTSPKPAFHRAPTGASVYVQTAKGVKVYSASTAGVLTEVSGSPFKTSGEMIGSTGADFISLGTDYVHLYPVDANGAIKEQVSEINTQRYSGAACGTTRGGVLFGQYVYAALTNAAKDGAGTGVCDALQTFSVPDVVPNTGTLAFLGSTEFDIDDPFVVGTITVPVVSGNGAFAYAVEAEGHGACELTIATFASDSGVLALKVTGGQVGPIAEPGSLYFPTPFMAADATNHVAIVMFPEATAPCGPAFPPQIASFTVGSTGELTSTNTFENMPPVETTGNNLMSISPSGTVLAYSVGTGVQFFHFNGADPVTPFTGTIGTSGKIVSMQWDNSDHLYAVNGASGKLHVYTATPTSVVETAGSPYAIGAKGVTVFSYGTSN
jgi:hypothetical protein